MNLERWFRSGDGAAAFDWQRPARDLDVPVEIARALYHRALSRTDDAERAEALYLRWLRDAAAARQPAPPPPTPGRQTRVISEAGNARGAGRPREQARGGLGKWTRVLLELSEDEARSPGLPGQGDVQHAIGALVPAAGRDVAASPPSPAPLLSGGAIRSAREEAPAAPRNASADVTALRERLVAAVTAGQGVADALAAADPATAAAALRELRGQGVPVLRLVARAADGEVERVLGRGSAGAALPGDLAARLLPHVGAEATGAARLHTDDAADLVASAHHAHAVTLGPDIYFARGAYAPGTERGDELLAHELTHVAQGQRGALVRAAAKGIDGGGTLDPAEAEADLRGRLASIQLHAPEGAAPPLAAPSGQPTSDGARQARLAAQQQRITLANQVAAPLAVPPAPSAMSPKAPVPHQAPKLPAPPAPAKAGNAYADTFEAPPSKQAMELWPTAGTKATTEAAADQARFDAALPPMPVVLDGRDAPAGKPGAAPGGKAPAQPPPKGAVPPAARPTPTSPAQPPQAAAAPPTRPLPPSADKAQQKAGAKKAIDALPTTAPNINTSPGTAPVTDLAGQADPVRARGDQQHAVGDAAKALDDAKAKVLAGPGAAQVQPAKLDEKLKVPKEQAAGPMPALPPVEGMTKLKQWNLPGNALAAFDDVARPRMDAHLAQAKAKMTEAESRRDADRNKAVSEAEDKVKQANADADKQQQTKVAQARTQIANHQADTLVKHEAEIKKLDQQSSDKKTAAIGKINTRISADQAKVETDYQAAQQKAEAKKKQGEAEAKKKKKEAEDKKKDESWWDQVGDAISSAVQAIADEINHVLDAIGKAIGDLLDAVKNAACQLIDAARDFVCQALTEFGDWLKSAVTALIGSVFPEIAAALNQLIDQAVSAAKAAVNAIADGLKKAVTALCEGLKAAVDAAIAAFKAAVQAAATFARALVTGDWSLVGKMILEGILKLLGIDPAAFYALIGKAMDSIDKIIENPGAFVGHLIDAVKLGFQQFGANFWTHLQGGLVQWLFGTFAQAGIRMPASFDIAGIFDLVCQVLGLTWPRLRGKVVKVIGEKNTERLEFVAKYLESLVTGGFAGLWEKIQQDMSGLWDMVVGGIKSWLIESVVQQAIIKIATMWNPAGAIIQLIQTAWNVYQWVRENAQRIFGLVQAVVDSISNIVAGNIGGAANFIESSLARLVPVAISLFADLLGLGGIADKIKGIIEKIQTKVDEAIDKLIARVMAMFQGKGDAGQNQNGQYPPVVEHFEMEGEAHTVTITRTEHGTSMVMASTPGDLLDKMRQARELCTTEIAQLTATKKGQQGQEAQVTGTALQRARNIKSRLVEMLAEYEPKATAGLDEEQSKQLALAIARSLVALGRQYNIRGFGEEEMDLRSMQQLGMPGHQHDHFIYEVLAELGGEVAATSAPSQDDGAALKTGFEAELASARSLYAGAIASSDHQFTFHGIGFVVEPQPMRSGGSANYIFPASQASDPTRYSRYGYQGFAWSVDALRDIVANLVANQPVDAESLTMFLAAMVAEPHRNLVTEVTNRLVLGPSTPGSTSAFAANSGVMPMTTGGTISASPDGTLSDVRRGSAVASGVVTDQEIEMAKSYYKQATGTDLASMIDADGESAGTKAKIKTTLRAQFPHP